MKTTNLPSISSPQVCPRYKELIRTLKCCYSPKWTKGSGENDDDALKRCVKYHWSVKKEKSITNSNTRYLREKKPEKIVHDKPKPEDCPHPEQLMYNSRIYPEAVIFKLFREFSILDLSKDAMEIDEDDEMALLNAIKKTGKHKSRKQIKREELKRQKQEVVMEKNEKKKSNSDAYSLKASAAAKHADAATRQQELESIKLAHSMGLYSNQELKNWMDKHLAKTFAAAAKSSLVVDLTSDDSDSNFNTPLKNPADKRISPAGSAAREKEGGEEINKDNQHVQTQLSPDVSSELGSDDDEDILQDMFKKKPNEPEPQPVEEREVLTIQNNKSCDENRLAAPCNFGAATSAASAKRQDTLTQVWQNQMVQNPHQTRSTHYDPKAALTFLELSGCAARAYCIHPAQSEGMLKCFICNGMAHVGCASTTLEGNLNCNHCFRFPL